MTNVQATIQNEYGIHVRPSAVIAKEVRDLPAHIQVTHANGQTADPKAILSLISLGLTKGQTVTISVSGPDEAAVAARIRELLETTFDFPR
jgi:phosphocarrier protein